LRKPHSCNRGGGACLCFVEVRRPPGHRENKKKRPKNQRPKGIPKDHGTPPAKKKKEKTHRVGNGEVRGEKTIVANRKKKKRHDCRERLGGRSRLPTKKKKTEGKTGKASERLQESSLSQNTMSLGSSARKMDTFLGIHEKGQLGKPYRVGEKPPQAIDIGGTIRRGEENQREKRVLRSLEPVRSKQARL